MVTLATGVLALFKRQALAFGAPPPDPSKVVSIPIVVYRQPVGSQWCWAAVAVSVQNHLAKAVGAKEWLQCELVTLVVKNQNCCVAILTAACNQPGYPDRALRLMGVQVDRGAAPLSWATTRDFLNRGVPIIAGLDETAGPHVVLIIGYAVAPTWAWVRKADPNYALTWVPFTHFLSPMRWLETFTASRNV